MARGALSGALRRVPAALVLLRLVLGPVLLVGGLLGDPRRLFAACLLGALVSDVLDGVLARRLGVASERLRRADSLVDTLFYVCALAVAWRHARALLAPYAPALGLLIALELARYAYDLRKFGREASYHMWSSKLWGVLLFAGMWALLVARAGGWPVALAILWGVVADLEGLAISFVLRRPHTDVPTLVHALRLRRADDA